MVNELGACLYVAKIKSWRLLCFTAEIKSIASLVKYVDLTILQGDKTVIDL